MDYDFIVVGAGASGCALAARLSEKSSNRVLLLEAGRDFAPGSEPPEVRDPFPGALGGDKYTWPHLTVEDFPPSARRPAVKRNLIQGQVVGGSSTINGMMAQRGLPSDFDEWETCGATGWGWTSVLPFFNALETDLDFRGPLHGATGPIPIRRERQEDWAPFAKAVTDAMLSRGHKYFEDFNAAFDDGVSRVPLNNLPDRRVSAAIGYLSAETRRRPNLEILADATATTLIFDGTNVVGVNANTKQGARQFLARETVVSAGAIFSPALLMRSGIGPADDLANLGIPVVADRPGVGKNLLNHLMIHVATHLPRRSAQPKTSSSWAFTVLRYSSGHAGCGAGDMQIFPINRTAWHPLGRRIGAIGLCLYRPFSVGAVSLTDAAQETPPSVKFNMLVDSRDVERLVDGLKLVLELFDDPRVTAYRNEVFLPNKAAAGRLATRSFANWLKTSCANSVFDTSSAMRRLILGDSVIDPRSLSTDREALREIVRNVTVHVHHVCGTCRIGSPDDELAVVDPQCRVYGVGGLRVVDASVMPRNISANTHLAAIMVGEKVAAMILNAEP